MVRTIQDPGGLGLTVATDYDLLGRAVRVVDAAGIATRYQYDNLGRLLTVIENYVPGLADADWPGCLPDADSVNVCAHYDYDRAGNRVQSILANGSVIVYHYDALGRLAQESHDPGGVNLSSAYGYDAAGNRVREIRAPGGTGEQVIQYVFDALGRELGIDYPGATPEVAYTYDAFASRAGMVDGTGAWSYTYDRLNRLVSVTDPNGQVVAYTYDSSGNRTGLSLANSPLDLAYTYDGAGAWMRPAIPSQPAPRWATATMAPAGWPG